VIEKVDEGAAVAVAAAVEGKAGRRGAAVKRRAKNATEVRTN
jgi:hypothetical protein